MSQPALVKAVGFAFISPEAFVLVANHKRDHIHLFPAKKNSEPLVFQREQRRQVVALRAVERMGQLIPHADKIDLIVAFGEAADLQELGIPMMDAGFDEDGKLVGHPRQSRDELLARIEKEAVELQVDKSLSTVKRARRRAKESAAYSGPTFRDQMRGIRDAVRASGAEGFDFVNEAAIPAVLRLMGDTNQADFKSACQGMIKRGGVPEETAKSFFKWVEGIDGIGPELGKAVDALLFTDDDVERTEDEMATQYGVDVKDVALVANSYRQITETETEDDE